MTSPTAAAPTTAAPRPPGILFLLGIVLALLAASWAAVGALLAPEVPGGWTSVLVAAVLVTVVPFAALIGTRVRGIYPGRFFRLTVFRFLWYAHFLLLLAMLAGVAGMLLGALGALFGLGTDTIGDWGRVAIGLTAAVYGVGMLAGYWGSRQLVVTELDITHPALPPELDGLRVVQLSDVHVGPHTLKRTLAAVAQQALDARPDLIAMTGDLIDDFDEDVEHYAAAFGHLAAPLGVWVIAGNHDIYANWPKVRARLARLPQRILVNEHVMVAHRGAAFAIAGTGDPAAGRRVGSPLGGPDLQATMAGVPDGTFTLVLAHNPVLWPPLAGLGAHVTLSGHTHWGQLAIPALDWCLASPFLEHAMGWHVRGGSLLYIHPGTNYWGIPFRLGAPPEVAVITLRSGGGAPAMRRVSQRQVRC
ncbi:MAG: metallophosphoesterase [Gemmatimonadetes bacterium]|nr:metallophosphoesterase [Gemmatimonadota bacterium]